MSLDRAVKLIWLLCGGILLAILVVASFFALNLDRIFKSNSEPQGIALDNSVKESTTIEKLKLTTNGPIKIGNSSNYLLSVYLNYENQSEDKIGFGSYDKDYQVSHPSNIIFLNKNLDTLRVLLNSKALITQIHHPVSRDDNNLAPILEDMNYIVYKITFEDTNQNKKLDEADASDLFISDLDGDNLIQITKGLNISSIEFLDAHETILIHTEETDGDKIGFYKYATTTKILTKLESIDESLQKIENILRK